MAGLKDYDVNVNGRQTTLRLSDDDAKARGLTGKANDDNAAAPADDDGDADAKGRTAANKSRAVRNKNQ